MKAKDQEKLNSFLRVNHSVKLFLTALLMLSPFTLINAAMQLIPSIQEIEVHRGRTATFTVTVRNIEDADVPSRFEVLDMDISEEGIPFAADSGWARGCSDWITLDKPEVIIKSQESIKLLGTVNVPKDAEGGYYALIRASFSAQVIPMKDSKGKMKESGISLENQAIVVLLFSVGSSRNRPEIIPDTLLLYPEGKEGDEFSLDTDARKVWEVVMPVRNDGNIHTKVSGLVGFWTEGGMLLESAPLKAGKGYILPGRIRNFKAKGTNILNDGYYMFRLTLQTSEGRSVTNSFPFAIYEGEVYPGALTEQLQELIRASSPGFILKDPFTSRKVTPGGSTYLAVDLRNTINDTVRLVPRLIDWCLDENGKPILGEGKGIQPRSCGSWLEFDEEPITLLPGRGKSFKIGVSSPSDMVGEFYAAIVFDPERKRPDLPEEFLSARTQLIAVSNPKDAEYKIKIDSATIKPVEIDDLNYHELRIRVHNLGNMHCTVTGNMNLSKEVAPDIYDSYGKKRDFGNSDVFILPGGNRTFDIYVSNLETGKYRLALVVNYQSDVEPEVMYQTFRIE